MSTKIQANIEKLILQTGIRLIEVGDGGEWARCGALEPVECDVLFDVDSLIR